MSAKQVFTAQTDNGDSDEFSLNGSTRVKISGDFGGGTVSLHSKSNNTSDSFSSTGTANDSLIPREFVIKHQQGWNYKLVLSGATSPNIDAFVSD